MKLQLIPNTSSTRYLYSFGIPICAKCWGFYLVIPICAKCWGFYLGIPICAKCWGFYLVIPICAKCWGFCLVIPICAKCWGFVLLYQFVLNVGVSILLGAIHKCQHFHECTNHTLSGTPSPPKRVHINNF